ncbi:MAG: S8 family serine peptidase [Bacteroidaceae bacterium]|nr:S8 family serine peptidase [Bacteroidaceae bacterium]
MKKSLLLALYLMMSVFGFAQGKLSNYTRLFLEQHKSGQQEAPVGSRRSLRTKSVISPSGVETVDCFVSLKNLSLAELERKGVEVNAIYGDLVSAAVPVDSIESLVQLNSVKQVSVSRQRRLLTDVAREKTRAQSVHAFDAAALEAGLTQAYTGKGVVLGIIDDGIQFNHTAFKDANGNTRIKAAYLPNATYANGGSKKTIDGVTLPGYQYTTATEIGKLTTDDKYESHGTHTAGCAGGSLVGKYSGMAPEVDLVLCGCGDNLSDKAISSSAKYIANYAKEQGKPCVISISLGSNSGPHDGTSNICQVYDKIAEDYGAIILLATGNEADLSGSVKKTLTSESNYMAVGHELISPITGYSIDGDVDFWNSTGDELQMQVVVLDSSGKAVYTSSKMSNGTISSSSLSSYFSYSNYSSTSGIKIAGGKDAENGRYNLTVTSSLGSNRGGYKLCYVVYGKAGNTITGWTDCYYTQFTANVSGSAYTNSNFLFTAGSGSQSLCDDVTGMNTISVGAYASRLSFPGNHGSTTYRLSNDTFAEQDIAYFSSYGVDFNGVQHPFVTAPGHTVVSSVNRYNTTESFTGSSTMDAYRVSVGSNTYDYWEYMSGTSMATPVAAGVVALYLQAEPTLTVDEVKELIQETAIQDNYTSSHAERFGVGKINALGGVAQLVGPQEPSLTLSDKSLLFTGYETLSYTKTVTLSGLRLTGDVNLSLSDANGVYEVSPTTISAADAKNGVEVTVRWSPVAAGETKATLSFSSEGAETQVLNLSGVAQEALPILSVNISALHFNANVGETSTQLIRLSGRFLTSDVVATLKDSKAVFSVSPSQFTATETGTEVTVSFISSEEGTFSATLTFSSENAESVSVQLTAQASDGGTAADAYLDIAKYATIDEAGWNQTYVNTLYKYTEHEAENVAWLTLPVYGVWSSLYYEPKAQKWVETNITSTTNAYAGGLAWSASEACLGSTAYFTKTSGAGSPRAIGYNSGKNYNEEAVTFYVTRVSAVELLGLGQSKSNSDYPASLEIYQCTKNNDGSVTAGKRVKRLTNYATSGTFVLSATELDASQIYKVVASTYRSMLCEIAFQTPLTAVSDYALGDTNMDGSVDISDVVLTVNYVLGSAADSAQHGVVTYGDMNADGSIDISDVVAIVNMILGSTDSQE